MRINTGITSPKETKKLLRAGAECFYAGILSNRNRSAIGTIGINRRFSAQHNLASIDQARQIFEEVSAQGAKFFITVNSFYDNETFDQARELVENLAKNNIKSIIAADLGLLYFLNKNYPGEFEIQASTMSVIENNDTVNVLADLGVDRFVFPRHLRPEEMKSIIGHHDPSKFEVFIFGQRCFFEDGHCGFQHGSGPEYSFQLGRDLINGFFPMRSLLNMRKKYAEKYKTSPLGCNMLSDEFSCSPINILNGEQGAPETAARMKQGHRFILSCGLCALWDFREIGITSLKIPNRSEPTRIKIHQIKLVAEAVKHLKNIDSRNKYEVFCKDLYRRYLGESCNHSYCYYG